MTAEKLRQYSLGTLVREVKLDPPLDTEKLYFMPGAPEGEAIKQLAQHLSKYFSGRKVDIKIQYCCLNNQTDDLLNNFAVLYISIAKAPKQPNLETSKTSNQATILM